MIDYAHNNITNRYNISYCPFYTTLAFLGFFSWPTVAFLVFMSGHTETNGKRN